MVLLRDAGVRQTVVSSAARTVSGASAALSGLATADTLRVQLNVSAASGTTPTLDAVIEDTVDDGATWNTIGTFSQKTAVSREVINITNPFTDQVRVRWTVGGTTPSFTFAVDAYIQ